MGRSFCLTFPRGCGIDSVSKATKTMKFPLAYKILAEADIPPENKEAYELRDGKWYLKIEGAADADTHAEFRNNNKALFDENKKMKEDLKRFEGIDPDKALLLMNREQEIMDEKLVKAGKIEEVVTERTNAIKNEHARQIAAKDGRIKELEDQGKKTGERLSVVLIDNSVLQEAQKRGLQPGAEEFLLARAHDVWQLDENGKPLAYEDKAAGKQKWGKDGGAISMTEWMDNLVRDNKFLFKPAQGSGAGQGAGAGGQGGGGAGGANPWDDKHWNPQQQMIIMAEDSKNGTNNAEQLMKAVGKKIGQMPPLVSPVAAGLPPIVGAGGVVR